MDQEYADKRQKVPFLTLPKLFDPLTCPYRALKSLYDLCPMSLQFSLFQIQSHSGLNPVTDSIVLKMVKAININLGLHGSF